MLLATGGLASDAVDVRAIDTEIMQFAGGHAAKFADGLTILAPVIERAADIHDNPLSVGSELPAICAGFRLLKPNIID